MKNILPINFVIQSFRFFIFLSTFYSVAQSRIVGGEDITEESLSKIISNHQESIVEITDWMQRSSFYATNQINVASSIVTCTGSAPLIFGVRVLVKVINVLGQVVVDGESCKGKSSLSCLQRWNRRKKSSVNFLCSVKNGFYFRKSHANAALRFFLKF